VLLDVAIPAGVDDGMRVRLAEEGQASPDGGPPGDAYCFIRVRPHRIFKREGNDLALQVPLSYSQAVLGTDLEIPTLGGKKTISVPSGTQSGEVFQLRGMGMPDPRSGMRGDLLVQTFVEIPKKVNAEQEGLLRKLAELDEEHVTPHRKSFFERVFDYFRAEDDSNGGSNKEEL
jgi:molecular chaperone DnaJ